MSAEEVCVEAQDREYRIRGLNPYASARMKVTVRVVRGEKFHIDSLDLYAARARQSFAEGAAQILGVDASELLGDLLKVIEACEESRKAAVRSLHDSFSKKAPPMTKEEERFGMDLLTDPGLLSRITDDMGDLGYIGEAANKALGYLVSISRKLPAPLSAVVVSRSSAGKSALLRLVERLTPPEDVFSVSSLTPESLFYVPAGALKHRLLLIEERYGSEPADYSIRELQTRHVLRKAVPAKDPVSGRMRTNLLEAEGPVAVMETTTNPRMNPENSNRCLVLHVDESAEQTGRVHAQQRRAATLVGMKRERREEEIIRAHHAAQRLLRPLPVVIPYAERLIFPTRRLRFRRDHGRFLSLIQSLASLYQYQRPVREAEMGGERVRFIEATMDDYRLAHGLMERVLASSSDDLSPLARRLLGEIRSHCEKIGNGSGPGGVAFAQREIREATGWGHDQVKRHVRELLELEYVSIVRGTPGARHEYRLAEGTSVEPEAGGIPDLATPEALIEGGAK